MLTPAKPCAILLAFALTGCVSGPHGNRARAPDWESEDAASAPLGPPMPASAPVTPPTLPSTRAAGEPFHETWISLARWCKANGLPAPSQLAVAPLATYALNTSTGPFVLRAGSRLANWNGLELRLGFSPQLIDGQLFIHTLDLTKSIQPLLSPAPWTLLSTNPIIVIDPGHGGENSGTKSVLSNQFEKEFTLDWAKRLARLLAANDWQVFLTRTNDSDLALSNRVAFAEKQKADLFLSLHFNSAAPDESQAGLETYCLTPAGMASSVTRGFSDDSSFAFPNNGFDAQNLRFAARIHRSLLQVNGNRDRGVRRARFLGVLRGQNRPAILVEGGYLSNPGEARRISDPQYRQRLAEAVAAALTVESATFTQNSAGGGQPRNLSGAGPEFRGQKSEALAPNTSRP